MTLVCQSFGGMQESVAGKARIADLIRNVTFVCGNYDRCIEHYFYNALLGYSGGSPRGLAARLLRTCEAAQGPRQSAWGLSSGADQALSQRLLNSAELRRPMA